MTDDLQQRIFTVKRPGDFEKLALDIFRYQSAHNQVYRAYIEALGINPGSVNSLIRIPFLPVSFFREHKILTGSGEYQAIFESSGTTGPSTSRHYVADLDTYETSFRTGFRFFYGEPGEYFFAALLPSYEERNNSSLIYMMNNFIRGSKYSDSGFFRDNPGELIRSLEKARNAKRKRVLLGVSFALLELAEKYSPDLSGTVIIETGGMKGRRKEITREELHAVLKTGFNVDTIHSEYGMTELLSQAWSKGGGIFYCPPTMKILIRDPLDPLTMFNEPERSGGINIIDLANINSCTFLSVNDIGKLHEDGGFEVLGRFDNSDLRGCNLLTDQ
jgi:phenylacetate-coenzyme A ligase PaaK-like adenylate-forming protein